MIIHLSDLSQEPLHSQISRQIREEILAGHLESGASLASIRRLAKSHKVSVITVQRAYEDLEREGFIVSRRGKGFFVKEITSEEKKRIAQQRFIQALEPVLNQARQEGLAPQEIFRLMSQYLDQN